MTLKDYLTLNESGQTPLYEAAFNGHLNHVVNDLRASEEKLSLDHFLVKNASGRTPLHSAAKRSHLDQVMAVLWASGEKLSLDHFLIKDNSGTTPLYQAATWGHLDQVFLPSYWTNRVGDLIKLWDQVSKEGQERAQRNGFDFQKIVADAIELGLPPGHRIDMEPLSDAVRDPNPSSQASRFTQAERSR